MQFVVAMAVIAGRLLQCLSIPGVIVNIRKPTVKDDIDVIFDETTEQVSINCSLLAVPGWNFVKQMAEQNKENNDI